MKGQTRQPSLGRLFVSFFHSIKSNQSLTFAMAMAPLSVILLAPSSSVVMRVLWETASAMATALSSCESIERHTCRTGMSGMQVRKKSRQRERDIYFTDTRE